MRSKSADLSRKYSAPASALALSGVQIAPAFLGAVATGGPGPIPYPQLFAVADATLAAVESLRRGTAIELGPSAYDQSREGGLGVQRPPFGG